MFKVECPGCKAPYQVDERRVPSGGLKMRCPKCGTSFQVEPPADARSTGPSPVLGAALGKPAAKKATMLGVAGPPQPPRPAEPKPDAIELADDPYGEVDLPMVGVRGTPPKLELEADLPAPRAKSPPPELDLPVPDDVDLPAPTAGRSAPFGELDLPAVPRPRAAPPAPPRPPPSPRTAPTVPRMAAPPPDIDLPVVGAALPARRALSDDDLALPSPAAGARAKAASSIGLPAAAATGLPSPASGLPSPAAGLPSPVASLPSPAAGLPSPASGLPSPASGPPSSASGLPSPASALPALAAGLPSPAGNLPSPLPGGLPAASAAGLPSSAAQLPERRESFGELELPLGSVPPSGPGVVRQAGGGTNFGEVNLEPSAGGVNIGADDDMEFGAIPQERSEAPSAAPVAPPVISTAPIDAAAPPSLAQPGARAAAPTPPKRGKRLRIVLGLVAVVALSGAALALVPSIGPFGAYFIVDQLKRGDYERLLADTRRSARELLAADTQPQAQTAQQLVEQARAGAERVPALSAYSAYVTFLRELRFGADSASRARAQVLLSEIAKAPGSIEIDLARAAEASASGQLARARQLLTALAPRAPADPEILVLRGELELKALDPKAALQAWQQAESAEKSARTAYGLARAHALAKEHAAAEAQAKLTLTRNPEHVGARLLVARSGWEATRDEQAASKLLNEVVADPAKASPGEIVRAQTLLGQIHLARSRITHAETAFGKALEIDPKAAAALAGLGEALFRAGRHSEALARFEAAVQADPDEVDAKVGVARAMLSLERVREAHAALEKLRETHPKSMQVAYWFGRASEAQGNRKAAEEAYRAAIAHGDEHPDVVQAYVGLALLLNQLGKSDEAGKLLAEARAKLPESPAIHKALGELALVQGRYDEAKAEFDKALAIDPNDVGTKFRLGSALRRSRSFDEAQRVFDEVGKVDRDYPGLALERGLLYEASGKSDEALKAYESALAKAPNDPDLMLRVGCGNVAAGRAKDAVRLLRKVLEKRPASGETLHCLGRALLVEGKNLVEALRTLERATEIDPHRAEYWLYVGWAANEAGRTARAETALAKALELDQGLADAYWQRGILHVRQGAVKDAVVDLRRALELRPTRYEAHAALADAYYDLGMEAQSLAEWQHAVQAMPDNAGWRFRYGKLLMDNRRAAEAREHLTKAIELTEEDDPRPKWLAEAHLALARAIGSQKEAVPHWKAFLQLAPRDSAYRTEAKRALEQLGQPWAGD